MPTLAERFRAGGYATAAFVSAAVLDRAFGLDRGFDRYDDLVADTAGTADTAGSRRHRRSNPPSGRRNDRRRRPSTRALAWLAEQPAERPVFLWVHLFEPHDPVPAAGALCRALSRRSVQRRDRRRRRRRRPPARKHPLPARGARRRERHRRSRRESRRARRGDARHPAQRGRAARAVDSRRPGYRPAPSCHGGESGRSRADAPRPRRAGPARHGHGARRRRPGRGAVGRGGCAGANALRRVALRQPSLWLDAARLDAARQLQVDPRQARRALRLRGRSWRETRPRRDVAGRGRRAGAGARRVPRW